MGDKIKASKRLRRHLCFLDVGHGNAAVLIAGVENVVVIDVGRQSALSEFLFEQGITHIQSIYISHADADHIGGLIGILATREVSIGRVILNSDGSKQTRLWDDLLYELNESCQSGSIKLEIGLVSGHKECLPGSIQIEVLAPSRYLAAKGAGSTDRSGSRITSNSISAVISISVHGSRFALLPGDLDGVGFRDLMASSTNLQAPILIYPHHGALPGNMVPHKFDDTLLGAVSPELVVFSIGRGRYTTPNPGTVRLLRSKFSNTRIICTQLSEHCSERLPAVSPTHLSRVFARGRTGNLCCGGTVVVSLANRNDIWPKQSLHAQFIRDHAKTALCT